MSHRLKKARKIARAKADRLALKEAIARLAWLRGLDPNDVLLMGWDEAQFTKEKHVCKLVILGYNSTMGEY